MLLKQLPPCPENKYGVLWVMCSSVYSQKVAVVTHYLIILGENSTNTKLTLPVVLFNVKAPIVFFFLLFSAAFVVLIL